MVKGVRNQAKHGSVGQDTLCRGVNNSYIEFPGQGNTDGFECLYPLLHQVLRNLEWAREAAVAGGVEYIESCWVDHERNVSYYNNRFKSPKTGEGWYYNPRSTGLMAGRSVSRGPEVCACRSTLRIISECGTRIHGPRLHFGPRQRQT